MSIYYVPDTKCFIIQSHAFSYVMEKDEKGVLHNIYTGKHLTDPENALCSLSHITGNFRSADVFPYREEYPCKNSFTFDPYCLRARFDDGTEDVRLIYKSHAIGKTQDGETLTITLRDSFYKFEVDLCYRTYTGLGVISKNAVIRNCGEKSVTLCDFGSGAVYTFRGNKIRLLHLGGSWGAEYKKTYSQVENGKFAISNQRGTCASHQHIPFFAADGGTANEKHGEIWYGLLHWSGNFKLEAEVNQCMCPTITAGINNEGCKYVLKCGESFETPLFTFGYTDGGYEKMRETLYDLQYDFLAPQNRIKKPFPIIYNTWYPYEMDVNEENCIYLVDKAKDAGAELFVIDDGWFPDRCGDQNVSGLEGLGDWFCDKHKFPNGLAPVADAVHKAGLLFGLWIEPEMVCEKTGLFNEHPEWVLGFENREPVKTRNQMVLNLARTDVLEFIWDTLYRIITEYKLDYLKWDMNSYITACGNALFDGNQNEIPVRYINNLYELFGRMNKAFPKLLIEVCAAGGGRSDYGMLPYADRINRSDNADPVDVLRLHEGFCEFLLPRFAGGAGNIAKNPSMHGRNVPLDYRAKLGMTGSMSIGMNILKMTKQELNELKNYLDEYKNMRNVTQNSYFYVLSSAFENHVTAWEYLSRDRRKGYLFIFCHGWVRSEDIILYPYRLRGLEENRKYRVNGYSIPFNSKAQNGVFSGSVLMNCGISADLRGDYRAAIIDFEAAD